MAFYVSWVLLYLGDALSGIPLRKKFLDEEVKSDLLESPSQVFSNTQLFQTYQELATTGMIL